MKREKKSLFASALCAALLVSFVACDKNDDPVPTPVPEPATQGVYLLNSGKSKSNNATLDYYDPASKALTKKVFASVNGRGLGDTANDMLVYGAKMYIAVDNSNTLEITDLNGKSLRTLSPKNDAGQPQSPRNLMSYKGKVYLTLFDGYLACVDTTTLEITKKAKVGPNPYQVCVSGDKLYVANSGGFNPVQDSTLSVVNPETLVEEKKVVVGLNPQTVKADSQGNLYVYCGGNFNDIKATVVRLNPNDGKVTQLYTNDNLLLTMHNDIAYVISSESNASTGWVSANSKFIKYDTKQGKELTANFITDGTKVEKSYCLSVDPSNGQIYIGTSDYKTTGDMYVFSAEGKQQDRIAVSGINPMGAFFVTK